MKVTNMNFSKVERKFFSESIFQNITTRMPYIAVESFPKLGRLKIQPV